MTSLTMNSITQPANDLMEEQLKKRHEFVANYQVGDRARTLGFRPARLIAKLLRQKAKPALNIGLFGYSGAGKSSAISLLINAVLLKAQIELVTRNHFVFLLIFLT
jgi:putative protein kinase ArgK-like GTPase of G3E family